MCFEVDPSGSQKWIRLANDTEAHMGDSLQVMEPDGREFDDALPEHRLPGSGHCSTIAGWTYQDCSASDAA
jgi:hypothetical protein